MTRGQFKLRRQPGAGAGQPFFEPELPTLAAPRQHAFKIRCPTGRSQVEADRFQSLGLLIPPGKKSAIYKLAGAQRAQPGQQSAALRVPNALASLAHALNDFRSEAPPGGARG